MKALLFTCSAFLFLGFIDLPIGYYTFLRIVVMLSGSVVVVTEYKKNGISLWVIIFGLIAILFNPIIPIHLQDKSVWAIIDVAVGVIFAVKAFLFKNKNTSCTYKNENK